MDGRIVCFTRRASTVACGQGENGVVTSYPGCLTVMPEGGSNQNTPLVHDMAEIFRHAVTYHSSIAVVVIRAKNLTSIVASCLTKCASTELHILFIR
jgi:hypothetical protein